MSVESQKVYTTQKEGDTTAWACTHPEKNLAAIIQEKNLSPTKVRHEAAVPPEVAAVTLAAIPLKAPKEWGEAAPLSQLRGYQMRITEMKVVAEQAKFPPEAAGTYYAVIMFQDGTWGFYNVANFGAWDAQVQDISFFRVQTAVAYYIDRYQRLFASAASGLSTREFAPLAVQGLPSGEKETIKRDFNNEENPYGVSLIELMRQYDVYAALVPIVLTNLDKIKGFDKVFGALQTRLITLIMPLLPGGLAGKVVTFAGGKIIEKLMSTDGKRILVEQLRLYLPKADSKWRGPVGGRYHGQVAQAIQDLERHTVPVMTEVMVLYRALTDNTIQTFQDIQRARAQVSAKLDMDRIVIDMVTKYQDQIIDILRTFISKVWGGIQSAVTLVQAGVGRVKGAVQGRLARRLGAPALGAPVEETLLSQLDARVRGWFDGVPDDLREYFPLEKLAGLSSEELEHAILPLALARISMREGNPPQEVIPKLWEQIDKLSQL
jgi:hypothetical protein